MWIYLLAIPAALAFWKRREIARLIAVNSLFSERRIVRNFSSMGKSFATVAMTRGDGPVSPLPEGPAMELTPQMRAWIEQRRVTSVLVLKDGRRVHESYHLGTSAQDLRISWSVAKSFLSALFGILVHEGAIGRIDEPVVKYVPELAGSAYDGARIVDVLRMSSGVAFNEDYMDFHSDINRMGRVLALGGSMDRFARRQRRRRDEPGRSWLYVSIDTHVIGMVLRRATGRAIESLMEEKLLHPLGLEAAPCYIADGHGVAFVLGGLNMRTRDYARFGQMFLQRGRWQGRQIVPESWVVASTRPSANTAPGETRYGYQWWIPPDGDTREYFARGIYGQHIYVNEPCNVVIATNAADRRFREDGVEAQNIATFRLISQTAAAL